MASYGPGHICIGLFVKGSIELLHGYEKLGRSGLHRKCRESSGGARGQGGAVPPGAHAKRYGAPSTPGTAPRVRGGAAAKIGGRSKNKVVKKFT
jgi:hypothetical protein